jgi:hypothetical protein
VASRGDRANASGRTPGSTGARTRFIRRLITERRISYVEIGIADEDVSVAVVAKRTFGTVDHPGSTGLTVALGPRLRGPIGNVEHRSGIAQ